MRFVWPIHGSHGTRAIGLGKVNVRRRPLHSAPRTIVANGSVQRSAGRPERIAPGDVALTQGTWSGRLQDEGRKISGFRGLDPYRGSVGPHEGTQVDHGRWRDPIGRACAPGLATAEPRGRRKIDAKWPSAAEPTNAKTGPVARCDPARVDEAEATGMGAPTSGSATTEAAAAGTGAPDTIPPDAANDTEPPRPCSPQASPRSSSRRRSTACTPRCSRSRRSAPRARASSTRRPRRRARKPRPKRSAPAERPPCHAGR